MFSDSRVPRLAAHQFLSAHEENMDNSAYVPNHLPPPSLVVFSQAGGLPEALRMQRPFNPQVTDSKDLQVPFSTAASLGYGLHHMLHLPPQFLHPLDHRLPFGGFRPLVPSAFAPPSKCLKVETGNGTVPGNGGLPSIGSLSSMSNMFSPTSLPGAGGGTVDRIVVRLPMRKTVTPTPPQDPRTLNDPLRRRDDRTDVSAIVTLSATQSSRMSTRLLIDGFIFTAVCVYIRKKKFPSDPSCCPVCGVTVRPQELEQHFAQELDRLYKVSSASSRPRPSRSTLPPTHPQDHSHGTMLHAPSAADGTPQGRWETYKRIKANRQARIRVKNRKRKADEASCPVCSERLSGTPEELNQHVDRCLNKQNNGNPAGQNANVDEEEVDVEGDPEYEEYEWAGQTRVRATSMLVGGFSAAGLATSSSNRSGARGGGNQEDEDVDLVVDGDDAAEFGPAQYSEADVVAPRVDGTPREQKERDALREAVISPNAPHTPQQLTPDSGLTAQGLVEVKPEPGAATPVAQQNDPDEGASGSPRRDGDTPVLEALRGRIRELEAEMRGQPFKCLICMRYVP
ncbi:PREDICTED: E3 ubiquitin-protein ligase RNF220-like [Trachymyrmex cornetzi]|uniref:E3 ubiquitin-protein ligase RNF220-like n=1 Tax=Trachymyrmex cornetzi TaxID=471704 RepID=UPI00084F5C0D|nr:PREDICTED: E3 ubiquitin-protein ligase RNF220-like [Trachymyrmex cornetzi]